MSELKDPKSIGCKVFICRRSGGLKVKGPMSKVTMSDLGLLDFLTFDQRFKIFSIAIFL
jgi:hypothetical protein